MFVRDFIHVDRPFETVAPRFVGSDLPIEKLAVAAIIDACMSFASDDPSATVDGLQCTRGALRSRGEGVVLPLRFVSDRRPPGPASLDGELEVMPIGERTELGFEANYRRPTDDQVAVTRTRRITELGVRSFLHSLGHVLES
jgi:hypothetical protein